MLLIFLLFNLISGFQDSQKSKDDCILFTLDMNLQSSPSIGSCNFRKTCSASICSLLKNTSLGAAAIRMIPLPLAKNITCPIKVTENFKTNIVTYILTLQDNTIVKPQVCYDMETCFNNLCNSYDTTKDTLSFAMTGQCK